jgi:tetratricopeptide (TPR) repeat protein
MLPSLSLIAGLLVLLLPPSQAPAAPAQEDPRILPLVERFFAAQEAKDIEAYLGLWSTKASRPQPQQLAFVFKTGDDRFTDIVIERVSRIGDLIRVTVSVRRERTSNLPRPDGSPNVSTSLRQWSLALVEEDGTLRILSEGFPADTLAVALLAAGTAEERAALMDAEADLLNTRLLQALSMRGDSQAQIGQHAAARAIYERVVEVARRIGNRKAEGEALQNIGNTYYFQNRFAEALECYERRLALERDPLNEAGAAGALLGIATIRYSSFEYGEALEAYREALAFYEALDDEAGSATALLSTGNVLYLQGDLEGAIADYRRSRDLYKRTHNTDGEARALAGLGRGLVAQGDYAPALDAFAGVWEEGRARGNRVMQANASHSTGDVHLRLGNADAARAAFNDSRQHLEAAEDLSGVGRAWQGTALAELLAGRFGAAEKAYASSMTACTTAADPDCVARAVVGLAWALYLQTRHDEAIVQYRKAIEAFTALNKPEDVGRAEVGLSQALFGKKEFGQAAAAAFAARDRSPVLDVVWRARLAEARARRQLQQPDGARASAQAAVEIVEAMAREALDQPIQRMSSDTTEAYTFLAVLQAEADEASEAFETVERGRAHALRLVLANNERDIVGHMTPAERDAERAAAARVGSLQAQLDKERALPKPDAQRIAGLEGQLVEAMDVRAAERGRMFERWPELRVWRGLAPAATAEEAAAFAAGEGTTVAQFLIDQDDLLVLTIQPAATADEGVRFDAYAAPVSRKTLADLVADAIRLGSLRDPAEWRAAAEALAEAIPPAVLDALAASERALLIPDGVLWRVPFEALPIGKDWLAARAEISYAASMTTLLRSGGVPRSVVGDEVVPVPVVAAAAPDLPEARQATIRLTAPEWELRDAAVAEREVATVASRFEDPPPVVLKGPDATEGAFRGAGVTARLLHLAAPFRVNAASPLFSPLLWAQPAAATPAGEEARPALDNPSDDGVLEPREVMNLDLQADVVVLSDGTATAMRDAAGAVGAIAWAWRAAGVPALILRRWGDDDLVGDGLIAEVHARVGAGQSPAAALRQARATVLARDPAVSPLAWAAWFVVR